MGTLRLMRSVLVDTGQDRAVQTTVQDARDVALNVEATLPILYLLNQHLSYNANSTGAPRA